MNSVLTGMQGLKCLVYLGDIVIYGASLENKRLEEVLQRLRENNLKLQPEFLRKETIYSIEPYYFRKQDPSLVSHERCTSLLRYRVLLSRESRVASALRFPYQLY